MKDLQTRIHNFLEDHFSPFTNNNDVDFDLNADNHTIMACSDLPGFIKQENYKLEYLYNYDSIKTFINQFSINSLSDLYQIDPSKMEKLFHLGYIDLYCHIYPSEQYLIFRRKGDYIHVSDEDMDHMLDKPLKTHEDFHAYTRYYFSA